METSLHILKFGDTQGPVLGPVYFSLYVPSLDIKYLFKHLVFQNLQSKGARSSSGRGIMIKK